jgi:hypothetical protein
MMWAIPSSETSVLTRVIRLHVPEDGILLSFCLSHQCICISLFPINATCLAHLIPLDTIILIIFGEQYKLRSSSLFSFLQPPVTSSLLSRYILCALFRNTFIPWSSLDVTPSFTLNASQGAWSVDRDLKPGPSVLSSGPQLSATNHEVGSNFYILEFVSTGSLVT